ncbi:hypothetical protein, partial [Cronobacter sakazakii]
VQATDVLVYVGSDLAAMAALTLIALIATKATPHQSL